MLRLARRAIPMGLLLVILTQSAALAATVDIQATNTSTSYFFMPMTAKVPQGSTAKWTNTGTVDHTTTADTTMPVTWDSGTLVVGATFSFAFAAAGKYTYHCNFHQ